MHPAAARPSGLRFAKLVRSRRPIRPTVHPKARAVNTRDLLRRKKCGAQGAQIGAEPARTRGHGQRPRVSPFGVRGMRRRLQRRTRTLAPRTASCKPKTSIRWWARESGFNTYFWLEPPRPAPRALSSEVHSHPDRGREVHPIKIAARQPAGDLRP